MFGLWSRALQDTRKIQLLPWECFSLAQQQPCEPVAEQPLVWGREWAQSTPSRMLVVWSGANTFGSSSFCLQKGKRPGATLGWGNLENRKGQKKYKDVVGKELFILRFSEGFYKQWRILKKLSDQSTWQCPLNTHTSPWTEEITPARRSILLRSSCICIVLGGKIAMVLVLKSVILALK